MSELLRTCSGEERPECSSVARVARLLLIAARFSGSGPCCDPKLNSGVCCQIQTLTGREGCRCLHAATNYARRNPFEAPRLFSFFFFLHRIGRRGTPPKKHNVNGEIHMYGRDYGGSDRFEQMARPASASTRTKLKKFLLRYYPPGEFRRRRGSSHTRRTAPVLFKTSPNSSSSSSTPRGLLLACRER